MNHSQQRRNYTAYILCMVALCVTRAQASEEPLIVFYDPDANHQAILSITGAFNAYLQENHLSLRLQPVASAEKLEELLKTSQVHYAIVSSAYLREHQNVCKPMLVPQSKGEIYYRKILFDRAGDSATFAGKQIAATLGEGRGGAAVIAMLKKGGVAADGAHVMPVSKDIDALLALSFGQVQAALVTQSSVEILQRINPTAAQSLRKIYETDKILRSPLCAVGNNRQQDQQLIEALNRMQNDSKGKRAMSSLGFDGWVPFAGGDVR